MKKKRVKMDLSLLVINNTYDEEEKGQDGSKSPCTYNGTSVTGGDMVLPIGREGGD